MAAAAGAMAAKEVEVRKHSSRHVQLQARCLQPFSPLDRTLPRAYMLALPRLNGKEAHLGVETVPAT